MKKILFSTAIFALVASGFSHAGIINEVVSDGQCSTTSVQITSITPVYPVDEDIVPDGTAINSTSCLGFITSPDNDFANQPDPNMGGLGDGLLNEEVLSKGKNDQYYVPGDYFLTHENDSMVNLDGHGEANDPGWIRLGGADEVINGKWDFEYDSIGNYNIGSVIEMSFYDTGSWILSVDPEAIDAATLALGRPSIFDHLAFVMKGPNNNGGSWAIYDFNFHDLIDDGWNISLGDTAYKFEGTWDTDLFSNKGALSHMSVWAHDPPAASDISEPLTLAIFGLGVIGLASRRFKKIS